MLREGKPLIAPSTATIPREWSFALAFFGRVRKVQEPTFALAAGRKSFTLKRILEAVLVILLGSLTGICVLWRKALQVVRLILVEGVVAEIR